VDEEPRRVVTIQAVGIKDRSRLLIGGEEVEIVAVMPLTRLDDWESVTLATNTKFIEIIERSRASAREHGTVPLAEVRKRLAPKRAAPRRRKKRR